MVGSGSVFLGRAGPQTACAGRIKRVRRLGQLAKYVYSRGDAWGTPAEEVSQGACMPVFAASISASAGRGYPKKVGAKTQVKKLLELGC